MQKLWMVMGAVAAMTSPLISAQAATHGLVSPTRVAPAGTTTLAAAPQKGTALGPLVPMASRISVPPVDDGLFTLKQAFNDLTPIQVNDSAFSVEAKPAKVMPAAGKALFGFDGLSHYDQRFAGTGVYFNTQFSEEPPDQALAVGNGYVLEAINNALAVYKTNGKLAAAPVPTYQFLGLQPTYIRGTQTYGSVSLSDPRAYYDAATGRFFVEEWGTGVDPKTGGPTGTSAIYLAVSVTSDPTGGYTLYTFDTTFDPNGPTVTDPTTGNVYPVNILPDYVQIGADANGFYMSINQFDLLGLLPPNQQFVGPRILAVSKADLVAGVSTPVVSFSGGDLANSNAGFTVQPAKTPKGGTYEAGANGTEYFLSTVFNTTANQLGIWAISNTASLDSKSPNLTLTDTLITSQPFSQPSSAFQKAGPIPYGKSVGYPEERLDSGDTRMTQVTYVMGHLYSAVETSFTDQPIHTNSGFTYFSVAPSISPSGNVSGIVNRQSYVRVAGETLSYPSFGISSTGGAVITCALVGPDFFPSAAYVPLDSHLKATTIEVSGLGVAPDDGFTGYLSVDKNKNPVQGIARWGDYSQAQPDEDGNIWLAQEVISKRSSTQRSLLANYGTFITKVKPAGTFSYGPSK